MNRSIIALPNILLLCLICDSSQIGKQLWSDLIAADKSLSPETASDLLRAACESAKDYQGPNFDGAIPASFFGTAFLIPRDMNRLSVATNSDPDGAITSAAVASDKFKFLISVDSAKTSFAQEFIQKSGSYLATVRGTLNKDGYSREKVDGILTQVWREIDGWSDEQALKKMLEISFSDFDRDCKDADAVRSAILLTSRHVHLSPLGARADFIEHGGQEIFVVPYDLHKGDVEFVVRAHLFGFDSKSGKQRWSGELEVMVAVTEAELALKSFNTPAWQRPLQLLRRMTAVSPATRGHD